MESHTDTGFDTVSGTAGDDTLVGTAGDDILVGGAGNDSLDGLAGNDILNGGTGLGSDDGDDSINGGGGNDNLTGDFGVDTLTGESGADRFSFNFLNQGTSEMAPNGIQVLNQPDIITDYKIGKDTLEFETAQIGLDPGETVQFQSGISSELAGDSNVLVLEDGFANAAEAAQAIADNDAISTDAGLFSYFNETLGISRVVASQDLSDGGAIQVLANLANVTDPSSQADFSAQDFSFLTLT
jgi:Ca2+-binding RTX toxin-like protein